MENYPVMPLIVGLVVLLLPLLFIFRRPPEGPNRFGPAAQPRGFVEAVKSFFRNYVNFNGRASRSEFWFSVLFYVGVGVILELVGGQNNVIGSIWGLATLLPALAVAARRLHDINRSGWHQVLGWFFPIGSIAAIIWYCSASRTEERGAPTAITR